MGVSKRALKINNYKLTKTSLKKCGFDRWRYVFNAVNAASGEERCFFIEIAVLNPLLNSDRVVLYEAQNESIKSSDLQAALAGNIDLTGMEEKAAPSYCCVCAGILGRNPRRLTRYIPAGEFSFKKNAFDIKSDLCMFGENSLSGVQEVTRADCRKLPLGTRSDVGKMEWNLKYEKVLDSAPVSSKKTFSWYAGGIKTQFSGRVIFDGDEFLISPDNSFGYADKSWGSEMPCPFLHISSSRMTSIFTGKIMRDSAFALESNLEGKVVVLSKFGEKEFSFGPKKKIKKYESSWRCVRSPLNSGGEELHWSVSINSKKYILDVDVFSAVNELIIKDYDMPQGEGAVLKIVSGASATGEIRLYRQIKKSLELIQHAKIVSAVAEYGVKDSVDDE